MVKGFKCHRQLVCVFVSSVCVQANNTSHVLILLCQAVKGAKGHGGRYNLAQVESLSLCYVYATDWLLACQTIINWHHAHKHTHTHLQSHYTYTRIDACTHTNTQHLIQLIHPASWTTGNMVNHPCKNKDKTKLTDRIIPFTRLIKTCHHCHGSLEIISKEWKQHMKIN